METTIKNDIISDSHLLLMQERDRNYTLDRLASDIKRSKKTIYKCFGSKDSLIREVFTAHKNYVAVQFDEMDRANISEIDKLIKYIYLVDSSIREIRMSRWYHQAKRYIKIKEQYFELRTQVYEQYLMKGLLPYDQQIKHYQKTPSEITNFIISSIEYNYYGRSVYEVKTERQNQYVDQLIFMLHGCLISLADV